VLPVKGNAIRCKKKLIVFHVAKFLKGTSSYKSIRLKATNREDDGLWDTVVTTGANLNSGYNVVKNATTAVLNKAVSGSPRTKAVAIANSFSSIPSRKGHNMVEVVWVLVVILNPVVVPVITTAIARDARFNTVLGVNLPVTYYSSPRTTCPPVTAGTINSIFN